MWFFKNFCSFLQQLSFFVYIAWVFCQIIQKIFIFNWTTWGHWYLLGGNSIFEQYSVWRIFWDENFLCCWLKKKVRAFRGIKYCLFQYEKPRDTQNMGKKSRYFSEIWTPKSITSLPILYDSNNPLNQTRSIQRNIHWLTGCLWFWWNPYQWLDFFWVCRWWMLALW